MSSVRVVTERKQPTMAARSRDTSRGWVLLPVLSVLLAALVILVAVLVDRSTPNPLSGAAPPVPILLEVQRREAAATDGVQVKAEVRPGRKVTSSARGVVTASPISTGDRISSGDRVVAVNDRWVVAYKSKVPPYRDLGPGTNGADVARLQAFLVPIVGYSGALDGEFGPATSRAVTRFNHSLGRTELRTTFARDSIAWIGAAPLIVGKVDASVGAEMSGPLFTGESHVAAISVTEPRGGVTRADEPKLLIVGDVSVAYESGSGRVTDPTMVAQMAKALPVDEEVAGRVTSADAQKVITLPASSIVSDVAGRTCVFTNLGTPPIVVTIVGGGVATVNVPADTPIDMVLSNPGDFRSAASCS